MEQPNSDPIEWDDAVLRSKFEKLLAASENSDSQASLRKIWTRAKIEGVLQRLESSKVSRAAGTKLTSMEYYWAAKYECVTIDGKEHLAFKKKKPNDPTVPIIPREEYYDVLKPVHISCGHGGRDKMQKLIKNNIYIPKKAIEIFNLVCPVCVNKRNLALDPNKTKERSSDSFNVRGLLDVLDFQFCPDGDFKWLLKYQEPTTKFVNFRPLTTNDPNEIAMELIKIFLTFGAPRILQSVTGKDNIAEILKEIKKVWPHCKTINGSTRITHCEPDSTVIENSEFIVSMIHSWMNENNIPNWSMGCYLYQYQLNTSSAAYRNMFCREPKQELKSAVASSTILSDKNSKNKSANQNQTLINKDKKLTDNQMEQVELKTEIKIEFDDSENCHDDSNSQTSNSKANNDSQEFIDIYVDNFDDKLEKQASSPDSNQNCVDPLGSNLTDSLKSENIEENENIKISCNVCQNAAFIDHTVVCFACKYSIHNKCGIPVIGQSAKVLCYACLGDRFPEFEKGLLQKGVKRRSKYAIIDPKTAKRVSRTVDLNVPGTSKDQ